MTLTATHFISAPDTLDAELRDLLTPPAARPGAAHDAAALLSPGAAHDGGAPPVATSYFSSRYVPSAPASIEELVTRDIGAYSRRRPR